MVYVVDPTIAPNGWARYMQRGRPYVRRLICPSCGATVEWSDTANGENERPPPCACASSSTT